ncbi:MAG: hypothetical protein CM1200mP29_12220 [Verrucomicrobiota bacterium]|nr:MAG: hypothetical protein CM1200mP29_12220 [Verrucomicrobiota bacterium]
MIIRIIFCLFLTLVALFCVFGFLATFEPLPKPQMQWTWRTIYGLIFIGKVAGLIHLIRVIFSR